MLIRKSLKVGLLATLVTATYGCKTFSGGDIKSIEAATYEDRGSVLVYCDSVQNSQGKNVCAPDGMVHYRICENWNIDRVEDNEDTSTDPISVEVDFNKLRDINVQASQEDWKESVEASLAYLAEIKAKIEEQEKVDLGDDELTSVTSLKDPRTPEDCVDTNRFYPPIPHGEYMEAVKNQLAIISPDKKAALEAEIIELRKSVKFVVGNLKLLAQSLRSGRQSTERYIKTVDMMEKDLKTLQEKSNELSAHTSRIRILNDIVSFLPKQGPNVAFLDLFNDRAVEAVKKPFEDRVEKVKGEYEKVLKTLHFRYIGERDYVSGMEACRAESFEGRPMVMAGRMEFYELNRFLNGIVPIDGFQNLNGMGQAGQGQDQKPEEPVKPLTGAFWVGTFQFDASYAKAVREYKRSMGVASPARVPYDFEGLSELANGVVHYLPANFHHESTPAINGKDLRFGFNYTWSINLDSLEYDSNSNLFGEKKQVLCVENSAYQPLAKETQAVKEHAQTLKWDRYPYEFSRQQYLHEWAGFNFSAGLKDRKESASSFWICSATGPTFDYQLGAKGETLVAPRVFNYHKLLPLTEGDGGILSSIGTKDDITALMINQCETKNTNVITGQGMCWIDVCNDCRRIIDGSKLTCESKSDDDRRQEQKQRQEQAEKWQDDVVKQSQQRQQN